MAALGCRDQPPEPPSSDHGLRTRTETAATPPSSDHGPLTCTKTAARAAVFIHGPFTCTKTAARNQRLQTAHERSSGPTRKVAAELFSIRPASASITQLPQNVCRMTDDLSVVPRSIDTVAGADQDQIVTVDLAVKWCGFRGPRLYRRRKSPSRSSSASESGPAGSRRRRVRGRTEHVRPSTLTGSKSRNDIQPQPIAILRDERNQVTQRVDFLETRLGPPFSLSCRFPQGAPPTVRSQPDLGQGSATAGRRRKTTVFRDTATAAGRSAKIVDPGPAASLIAKAQVAN